LRLLEENLVKIPTNLFNLLMAEDWITGRVSGQRTSSGDSYSFEMLKSQGEACKI